MDVETLDGAIRLKVPEGTQAGDVLKVRGKGAHVPSGYGRGNLLIEMKIDIPRKVSRKMKKYSRSFQKKGFKSQYTTTQKKTSFKTSFLFLGCK